MKRGERPSVLIVGGVDVDQRIDLMCRLEDRFVLSAAGSGDLERKFADTGFKYFRYPLIRGVNPWSDLRTYRALVRLFGRERPDVVHTFATKPSVWGRLAAYKAEVPVVVGTVPGLGSLYSSDALRIRAIRGIYSSLLRSASRRSDLTILQNRSDATELVGAGVIPPDRAVVIPGSGVRTDLFTPVPQDSDARRGTRERLGISGDTLVVTMVARVIRPKGVLEYAAAARTLSDSGAVFLLVGPDDRDSVDCLSSEELAAVSASIRWLGERSDVRELLRASDVFALPTYYREGIPRVLLEAAAIGLPLVAARVPGCEDVIEHERNGLLVPPKDSGALAAALRVLIEDPAVRSAYGEQSRLRAIREFDLSVIAQQIAGHYQKLLAQAPGGLSQYGPDS